MDALFKKVSKDYRPIHREILVFYNIKKNQVSKNLNDFESTLSRVGLAKPSIDTYAVDLNKENQCSTGQFKLDDFSSSKQIDLKVDYLVQVNELSVEQALVSFIRSDDLERLFNNYITALVKDYSRTKSFVESPNAYISDLQRYLSDQLKVYEPGFSVACRVKIIDFMPDKEHLSSEPINIRFKGGKGEIKLFYNAEVAIDNYHRDEARQSSLSDKNRLRSYLMERVRGYFLERIEQHDFFDQRKRRTTLTQDIEVFLNQELRGHGRKLVFFEFNEASLKEHSAPEGVSSLPVQVICQVRQASKFIKLSVSTVVSIDLDDEGRAIMSGITSSKDLEAWATKHIKEIVETTFLAQVDFADVVIAFFDGSNNIEQAIGKELEKRAFGIGYKLKYYNVLPDLHEYEDKRVSVKEEGVEFKTKGGDIPLFLSFEVEGMIKSWSKIKEYLRPDKDLKKSIAEKVITAIKEVILENYAERTYMHFYEPYEEKLTSVEKELHNTITGALEQFALDELKIRLIPAESDIKSRFAQVVNKIQQGSVVFKSLRKDSLPEDIHYHFSYRITGIDRENAGFNIFYSSKDLEVQYWLGQISERIKTILITFLNTMEAPLVKYEREEIRRFLENAFKKEYAVPEIKRAFGMEIDIHEFRRDLTEKEKEESKTASHYIEEQGKTDREQLTRELAGLLEGGQKEKINIERKLNELYQYGVFKTPEQEAEIKRLETQLAELNDRKDSAIDKFKSQYKNEEHTDPLALLAAKKAQQLGEAKPNVNSDESKIDEK